MIILEVLFLIMVLTIIIGLWWIHQKEIMADIAKEEAEEYIDEQVDKRFKNAQIRVKQQLYIIDEMQK